MIYNYLIMGVSISLFLKNRINIIIVLKKFLKFVIVIYKICF